MKKLTRTAVAIHSGRWRQKRLKIAALAILPLSLFACATKPVAPNPGLKESFHTEIAANGAKRFTYSLERLTTGVPDPYTRSSRVGRPGGGAQARAHKRQETDFNYGLALRLRESNFCRDGYFELERSVSAMGAQVRGECRDGHVATADN